MYKISSNNVELNSESIVLSCIIVKPELIYKVFPRLSDKLFYLNNHKVIWLAIKHLYTHNKVIDIATIISTIEIEKLHRDPLRDLVIAIAGLVISPTIETVQHHISVLIEMYMIREKEIFANRLIDITKDKTKYEKLISIANEHNIMFIDDRDAREFKPSNLKEIIDNLNKDSSEAIETGMPRNKGLSTGYASIDDMFLLRPQNVYCIAARPAMGKDLTLTSKIVTPTGLINNGDIKVGMEVMGSDDNVNIVTGVFPQGLQEIWRVTFDDKTFVDCGAGHLWTVQNKSDRRSLRYKERTMTTEEMSKNVFVGKNLKTKNYSLPFCSPINFYKQDIELNPYLLGVWIGDGTVNENSVCICNPEEDIISRVKSYLPSTDEIISDNIKHRIKRKCRNNEVSEVSKRLKELNLLGKKSHERFIPKNYLYNNVSIRLDLLRGLLDTDGHVCLDINKNKTNNIQYTTTSEQLKDDVCELVRGLGGRATWSDGIGKYSGIICKKYYRIYINFSDVLIPVQSKKHLKRYSTHKQFHKKFITSIEKLNKKEETSCISVNARNNLYITNGYTLTHNTSLALNISLNVAIQGYRVLFFAIEMSQEEMLEKIMSFIYNKSNEDIRQMSEPELIDLRNKTATYLAGNLSNLIIDDFASDLQEIKSAAYDIHRESPLDLIVIDYLQLIECKSSDNNRNQEITKISRTIKTQLSKKLKLPVLMLSQLNRSLEARKDRRPNLQDLRESGCLAGDTIISDSETGKRFTIEEMTNMNDIYIPVASLDEKGLIVKDIVVKAFPSGEKSIFCLKTNSGREIKASANHKFLTMNGWKRLDELSIGEQIALPRHTSIISPTNPLSDNELILLGHLLGDGCILPHQSCHYTNKDMLNIMSVKNAAYQLFGITGKIIKQNDYYHIYLPHPKWIAHKDEHSIAIWYKKLGINMVRSYDKVIPNGVFECDSDKIALFLRHLWSTDGNLSWKFFKKRTPTCAIYYSSTSKKLATQVQELLLRLEIFSTITVSPKEGYRDSYLVQIFGCRNQLKFINNIGINDTRNNEVPEMKKSLLSIKENLNNDIFPKDIWNIIREEKSKCDLSWREISKRINTSFCGFALFKSGVSRNRLEKIAEVLDSEKLHEIANSDILWDKVNFITKLGVEKTYDITTKEHHNFIANDIIVHNSIEQDVTSVLFIYRDEVYGIELDRKGRSTKNIAEFIVKKNRFGESPKTKRIKFNASFTRFEDIPEDNGFFFKR